jgi:hypothetical protein
MGVGSNGTLPVSWISFTANANGMDAILNWATATEINNKGFEVERSLDGATFKTIGFVKGNVNSGSIKNYDFTDASALEIFAGSSVYYRLKQVDFDGNYSYSNVVLLNTEEGSDVTLYPNPFNASTGLFITAIADANISIEVKDLMGRSVFTTTASITKGGHYISIDGLEGLSDGMYLVQVTMNGELKSFKVQKTK